MPRTVNLPYLTDTQVEQIKKIAPGIKLNKCPTCGSVPEKVAGGFTHRTPGTYTFDGDEYDCNCDDQLLLRGHYLLRNIPQQYMNLDWNRDYIGPEGIKQTVNSYVEGWEEALAQGIGVEFGGTLGVGKTFAATHIGKKLIKHREQVLFAPFAKVIDALSPNHKTWFNQNDLEVTSWLILDEVTPPPTDNAASLFSDRLEAVIRNRTNMNYPTIMTTNMTEESLEQHYPRTYSLLCAKQIRIEMPGDDVRQTIIGKRNLDMMLNRERRPIT